MTGFADTMDKRDLPVIYDPVVSANTPISQRRKRGIGVSADETASSPKEERFMRRKRAIESAEEAELNRQRPILGGDIAEKKESNRKLQHVTMTSLGEPATTNLATTPNSGETFDDIVMEETNPLADWDHHLSKKKSQPTNELDRYLQEETFPCKDDFDILQWWSIHSSKYPVLSRIARDILAVPASVVPSESAFSTGSRVISDYRSRLDSKTVEALIYLQDWLKHYDSLANLVDDNDL